MPLYEHVFLARHDISAQQVQSLIDNYGKIIKDKGGKIGKTEYWGLQQLAYKIKKNRRAHYALMNIDAPHDAVAEMERQMQLANDVIRFLTLRVDKHDDSPSPRMKKGGRDDGRRSRRFGDGKPPHGRDRPFQRDAKPDQKKDAKPDQVKDEKSEPKMDAKPDQKKDAKPDQIKDEKPAVAEKPAADGAEKSDGDKKE